MLQWILRVEPFNRGKHKHVSLFTLHLGIEDKHHVVWEKSVVTSLRNRVTNMWVAASEQAGDIPLTSQRLVSLCSLWLHLYYLMSCVGVQNKQIIFIRPTDRNEYLTPREKYGIRYRTSDIRLYPLAPITPVPSTSWPSHTCTGTTPWIREPRVEGPLNYTKVCTGKATRIMVLSPWQLVAGMLPSE